MVSNWHFNTAHEADPLNLGVCVSFHSVVRPALCPGFSGRIFAELMGTLGFYFHELLFELMPSSFESLEEIVCDFCCLGLKSSPHEQPQCVLFS
jgi:hypothetical protein